MQTFLMILLALASLCIIVAVMFQDGGTSGLSGAISGGAEQLFGKKKGNAKEELLKKVTIVSAVVFMLASLILVTLG